MAVSVQIRTTILSSESLLVTKPACMRSVVALAVAGLSLFVTSCRRTIAHRGEPQTPAQLWLSWTPEARVTYVSGFLSGFDRGKTAACYFYQENVRSHGSVPVEKLPHGACMNSLPVFRAPYFQTYVDALTEYYRKYPHDREAGASRLLLELASPPNLTIQQIHAKLDHE